MILTCILASVGLSVAQTTRVSGTVLDDTGETVIGASVVAKGSTVGTVTDIDGKFSLNIPSDKKTLVISLIGYKTKEVAAGTDIKVTLDPDAKLIDEVVVVAYGVQKKSSLTGATTSISADQISNSNKESVDKALVGKIAGVRVSSNTGDPGSAGEITIRGFSSINGSTRPLYVIDGIPIDVSTESSSGLMSSTSLSSFNPDEIESVTVLKDAAAASLYGSRATNGVIIITTKKGKTGRTKVSYSGQFGSTQMAVKQFEMADAKTTIDYYREGAANVYELLGYAETREEAYAMAQEDLDADFADPTGNTNTDWWDQVYRTGKIQDHQVSVTGGSEQTKLFANLGYNKTEGYVKGSEFQRYSGRINVDHAINKHVDLSVKQSISYTDKLGFRDQNDQTQGIGTASPLGILFAMDPTATVHNSDGTINANAGWGQVSNPKLMLGSDQEFVKMKTFRSLSNVNLIARLSSKVTLSTSWAYDFLNAQTQEFWGPESVNGSSLGGLGYRVEYTKNTWTSSTTLRYANTFNKLHNFDILGGFESNSAKMQLGEYSAKSYSTGKLPELSAGQPYNTGSSTYESALLSWLGTANYNYDQKYYLGASFRADGSSFFGKDNRWGTFYSVSGAWRITQESFFPETNWIRDFKLRASLGTTGNQPSDYFKDRSLYSVTGGYGSNPAIYWSQDGDSKLGWEKTTSYNIGFDWNIYDRVNLTVEYYNKDTKDLLFKIPTSYVTGFENILTNLGRMKNHGLEIEINSRNVMNKNFTWQTNFNITFQGNEIKELPNGDDVPWGDGEMYVMREGEAMFSFNLPVWKGVDPQTGLGQFLIDPTDESKGTTPYYSRAGKTILGKPMPNMIGGITNTFTYRDFDLSFLISFQSGGKLFDYPGYFSKGDGVRLGSFGILKEMTNNYWKNPGDVVDNPKPIAWANPYRSDRWSSRHILSTDNIRMREISFGYNVPVRKISQLDNVISSLRLFFSTTNTFMIWSKNDGIDPDVPLNGYRQVDTPAFKTFTFGLNVEF